MRGVDLGIMIALVVAVAGGTAYVVQIRADVDELSRLIQFDRPLRFSTGGRGRNNERLIRVDEGICYLTRVTGDFNGNGEWAHVRPTDDGFWNLQTDSRENSGAGAWIYAEAHCLRFPASTQPEG